MKKMMIGTIATTLLISGAVGINAYAQGTGGKVNTEQSKQLIGDQKAIEVALKEANGTVDSVELETENNKTYYEVDIDADKNKEFEVKVDAYTATVLNVKESYDDDDDNYDDDSNGDKVDEQIISKESLITEDKAIAIAKKEVNGEIIEVELDSEDGKYEYEIELQTKKGETDITIDAKTGKVLEQELDDDNDND